MDELPQLESCCNLPDKLDSCNAFERVAGCAMNSFMYITYAQNMLLLRYSSAHIDISTDLGNKLEIIENRYSVFYIINDQTFDDEKRFEEDDEDTGLIEHPNIRKIVLLIILLSRTLSIFVKHDEEKFELLTATELPGVVNQMLAQFNKPIMSYTASELIHALDALAFRWNLDIDHTLDIDRYIYLLSIRFGMFLLWGLPISEYGTDAKLRKQSVRVSGSNDDVCSPSRSFFVHATGRLMAFTSMTWHIAQYNETIVVDDIPRRSQLEIAKLFLKYTKEGINKIVIPYQFSKLFQGFSLSPGDSAVFVADNRFKRCTIRNMLRLIHGKRFVRCIFRQATQMGPIVALTNAVLQLSSSTMIPNSNRSDLPFESEIASITVMSAILRGKYNIAWIDDFFITGINHVNSFSSPALPKIVFVSNTFDVVFNGIRYKTSNILTSICKWLQIIKCEYNGVLPPPYNCNISDLCDVITGTSTFEVSTHWVESTVIGSSTFLKRQMETTDNDVLIE